MSQKKKKEKKAETYLSLTILVVLAGIGIGIFLAQFSFNPAVFPIVSTIPGAPSLPSAPATQSAELLVSIPKSLAPMSPPEVFTAQNLYEKINGKAELYLSAGFQRLQNQRFTEIDDPNSWTEVFVYDMGNIENAFAVFSTQRRDDAEPVELAQFSYKTKNALFLMHGPYYVEIIAALPSEKVFKVMKLFAENFIGENRVEVKPIAGLGLLPSHNLDENSISLHSSNAFGYNRLDRVFTAIYKLKDTEIMAFVSKRGTSQEAKALASGYNNFLIEYGGKNIKLDLEIKSARMVEIMETFELIFTNGPYLAGIHEAADKEKAENLGDILNKKLKEVVSEHRHE